MDKGLIPRRYAKALLEVAEQRHVALQLYDAFAEIDAAFTHQPDMSKVVKNPFVKTSDKITLLETAGNLVSESEARSIFEDFVKLTAENGRVDLLKEIIKVYIDEYRRAHDIVRVEVESAVPLGDALRERLTSVIRSRLPKGATIEMNERVDPDLIGGFVININNERLDASVKHELEQLRLNLLK